jgi:hypothetical protein
MRVPRSDLDLFYSDVRSGYLSKINQILEPSLIVLPPIVLKILENFWVGSETFS